MIRLEPVVLIGNMTTCIACISKGISLQIERYKCNRNPV